MFRGKDREKLDVLHHKVAGLCSEVALGLGSISRAFQQLQGDFDQWPVWRNRIEERLERLEQGQSVLKADLDALAAEVEKRIPQQWTTVTWPVAKQRPNGHTKPPSKRSR